MFDLFQLLLLVILAVFTITTISLDIQAIRESDNASVLDGGSTNSKWLMGVNYGMLGVACLAILVFFAKMYFLVKYRKSANNELVPKGFNIFQMFLLFILAVFIIVAIALDIEAIKSSDQAGQIEGDSTHDKWVMGLNYGMIGVSALAILLFLVKLYFVGQIGEGRAARTAAVVADMRRGEPMMLMNPAFEDPRFMTAAEEASSRLVNE